MMSKRDQQICRNKAKQKHMTIDDYNNRVTPKTRSQRTFDVKDRRIIQKVVSEPYGS